MTNKEFLLEALLRVKSQLEADKQDPNTGLCWAVNCQLYEMGLTDVTGHINDIKLPLKEIFKQWPEFSGDIVYPIAIDGAKDQATWLQFDLASDEGAMWTGEYGAARIRLLDFCIVTLEKELAA